MKTIVRKLGTGAAIAILFTVSVMAQPPQGKGFGPGAGLAQGQEGELRMQQVIPDLTDEQASQLKALKLEHLKKTKDFRNQMGELRARQRTLMSADEINQKEVEKLIDQKTALMNKQMKENVAHRASVNKILTEEQLLALAQMNHRRGQFNCGEMRPGHRQGFGQGYAREGRPCRTGLNWK